MGVFRKLFKTTHASKTEGDLTQNVTVSSQQSMYQTGSMSESMMSSTSFTADTVSIEGQQVGEAPEFSAQVQKPNDVEEKKIKKAFASIKQKFQGKAKEQTRQTQVVSQQAVEQGVSQTVSAQQDAVSQDTIDQVDELVRRIDRYFDTPMSEEEYQEKVVQKLQGDYHRALITSTPVDEMFGLRSLSEGAEALQFYSLPANYRAMNGILRKDNGREGTAEQYEQTQIVAEFLNTQEVKDEMVTVRHMKLSALTHLIGGGKIEKMEDAVSRIESVNYRGLIAEDKGFTSTSTNPAGSPAFNKHQVEVRTLIHPGTHGCYMREVSDFRDEDEFLLQAGTKFRVLKMECKKTGHGPEDSDPKMVVYVEALQDNEYSMGGFPPR